MPPKVKPKTSISQNVQNSRVQSANSALRNTDSPIKNKSTNKTGRRSSYVSKLPTGVVNGRNEMEMYFERLLALERIDGLDAIGTKGIQKLCEDLSIDMDSFEMYTLIWKMGITRSGCIPRNDWLITMYTYKIEQLFNLKMNLVEWVKEAKGKSFHDFYCDIYDYIRGEEVRIMSSDIAIKAWKILFQQEPRIKPWIQWYSLVHKEDVSRDLWRHLEIFLSTVSTIEEYRVEDKWPSAIDNYVEWCNFSH